MARTFEDFVEEDGKLYQVRTDDHHAFLAQMQNRRHQAEAGVVKTDYKRLKFSIPATIQLQLIKDHGREMDPARYGKMSEAEKRKFDQIIRSKYPACVMDWGSRKYHQGGIQ